MTRKRFDRIEVGHGGSNDRKSLPNRLGFRRKLEMEGVARDQFPKPASERGEPNRLIDEIEQAEREGIGREPLRDPVSQGRNPQGTGERLDGKIFLFLIVLIFGVGLFLFSRCQRL